MVIGICLGVIIVYLIVFSMCKIASDSDSDDIWEEIHSKGVNKDK